MRGNYVSRVNKGLALRSLALRDFLPACLRYRHPAGIPVRSIHNRSGPPALQDSRPLDPSQHIGLPGRSAARAWLWHLMGIPCLNARHSTLRSAGESLQALPPVLRIQWHPAGTPELNAPQNSQGSSVHQHPPHGCLTQRQPVGIPARTIHSSWSVCEGETGFTPFGFVQRNPQFCVVGSGPAGFYTADKLLKAFPEGHVSVLDRLPTPFGLVRTGVAPDHPETKFVTNQFTKVAANKRFSFFGNVRLGSEISLPELRSHFDAVVLAYGAEGDRNLGIPGEGLANSVSAREFVGWYNGHPDYVDLPVDLTSTDTAVVLGQGNVALDVARVLLRSRDQLASTDIAEHAVEALRQSRIRTVHVVGRRGPVQAACTAKEVRELLGLQGVSVTVDPRDFVASAIDEEEMKQSRGRRRVRDLLLKGVDRASHVPGSGPCINFVFFRSPVEILPRMEASGVNEGQKSVGCVVMEKTMLTGGGHGLAQRAVGTGETEVLECGLVLRSIGYKSLPVPDIPFDSKSGVVPNQGGRVIAQDGAAFESGLYVCGWLKRGPTGIIGTNEIDATETVASMVEDFKTGRLKGSSDVKGHKALEAILSDKGVRYCTFEDWLRIDWEERRQGKQVGKQREKIVRVQEMLEIAGK